jgi:hypothetical protein
MSDTSITTVTPVEEQIQQELVKHNVTEAAIAALKEKYMGLQIKGMDDKETYLAVKEGRKECKGIRVLAEKLCKKGREEANAIQKAWVAKEKDVTGRIGEVEDHLEKQEKDFEAKVAAEKERRKREQEEQFILRNQVLSGMGVLYSDGHYTLGEVSFEMILIKECDPDIWENDIKPKFEEEYQKVEAERIAADRLKEEREAELKRQQEALEKEKEEIEQQKAALKAAQEKQERKEREEYDRQMAEAKAKEEDKWKARADQLHALGLKIEFFNNHLYYNGYDCSVSHLDITGYDDEKWDAMIDKITPHIAEQKAEEERQRLAEIEAQKAAERKKALIEHRVSLLGSYGVTASDIEELASATEEQFAAWYATAKSEYEQKQKEKWEKEQEEKRKAEELKKQQEMEQAGDKTKWGQLKMYVDHLEVVSSKLDFRSGQYRTKALKFRQKLDELKALFDADRTI